jgi:hypothetical protein
VKPKVGRGDLLLLASGSPVRAATWFFSFLSRRSIRKLIVLLFRSLRIEKRRAGLDADVRLWIILDEYNSDIIGHSFYWSRSYLWDGSVKLFFSLSFGSLLRVVGRPARFTAPDKEPCDVG